MHLENADGKNNTKFDRKSHNKRSLQRCRQIFSLMLRKSVMKTLTGLNMLIIRTNGGLSY
jgi:hypothetical protein